MSGIALAVASVLSATSVGASDARLLTFNEVVGDWRVVGDPEVAACVAWHEGLDRGTRLTIAAKGSESTYRFVLRNPAWKSLSQGGLRVRATFLDRSGEITNMWNLSAEATSEASGGPQIHFDILRAKNDSADFIDQFKRATSLWFWRDEVPIADFKLVGSAAMMNTLARCRAHLRIDETFDPFAD